MQMSFSPPTIPEEARRAIEALDLHMVKRKLMESESGEKWTQEQVSQVEIFYRRFLFLCWKYQACTIVPTKLIDRFWHQHILDTVAYAKDCQYIFGRFVHHNPYFGMDGEQQRRANLEAFALTQQLWLEEFAEVLTGVGEDCCSPNYCGAGCGSVAMCTSVSSDVHA